MIVTGLAVALGAATPLAIAAPARPSMPSGWNLYQYFGSCGNAEVTSVTSIGPNTAWATGQDGYCSGPGLLLGRWDGFSWQQLQHPTGFGSANGTAVAALSSTYSWIFVTKVVASTHEHQSFALLRSGGRWHTYRLADGSDISSAVAFSTSDAWGFGSISHGSTAAYAVHFNGHTWRRVLVPVAAQGTSGDVRSNVWAVGKRASGSGFALAHWTGHWSTIPFPSLHLPPGEKVSQTWVVHDSSGGAWVTADVVEADNHNAPATGLLLHWTGTRWIIFSLPVQVNALGPIAHDGFGGMWITSYPTSLQCTTACDNVEMLDYNSGTWTTQVVPVENLTVNSIRLIRGTTDLWAGGYTQDGKSGAEFAVMLTYGF